VAKKPGDEDGNYLVGYGKPPVHTQFKKGQSGNPNGRPKGVVNFHTAILRAAEAKIHVMENGRSKTITKLEAATIQVTNKAAAGDVRAYELLSRLIPYAEERQQEALVHAARPVDEMETWELEYIILNGKRPPNRLRHKGAKSK